MPRTEAQARAAFLADHPAEIEAIRDIAAKRTPDAAAADRLQAMCLADWNRFTGWSLSPVAVGLITLAVVE